MDRNIFFLIVLLSLVFFGCERKLEIPLPEHQPKLVANSLVQSGENFQVFVSRSFGLNEDVREVDIYIKDARVELWRNGQLEEVLFYRQGDTIVNTTRNAPFAFYGYFSEHKAQPGSTYELRISHPDYPDFSQEMFLPFIPNIIEWELLEDVGIDTDGERIQRLLATLQDPADTANHYRLTGSYVERSLDTDLTFFPDRRIETRWVPIGAPFEFLTSLGYIMPDTDFDGQTAQVGFEDSYNRSNPDVDLFEPDYMVLEWQSWNEAAYAFANEYEEHVDAYQVIDLEILFASQAALPMYSNAEGGFGIFGGYTVRRDTIFF